jgi:DNA-binding NarL/FixJ family response regulator
MLRVDVISSSTLVRAGIRAALDKAGRFEVAGTHASVEELLAEPVGGLDVVIVELGAGEQGAIAKCAAEGLPPMVVLVDGSSAVVGDWLTDGLTVIPSDAPGEAIAAAAWAAASGLVATSRTMLTNALRFVPASQFGVLAAGLGPLTAREDQVLAKLAQGLTNGQIADALHISTHTAKFHVAQIIAKLDASSRAHVVAKALRAGLVRG